MVAIRNLIVIKEIIPNPINYAGIALIIIGVLITIIGSDSVLKAKSDADGVFHIYNINAGRYDVQATFTGYKDVMIPNVVVTNGKEVVVDISSWPTLNFYLKQYLKTKTGNLAAKVKISATVNRKVSAAM